VRMKRSYKTLVVKEKSYFFDTEGRAGRRPAGRDRFAGRGRSPDGKGSASKRRRVRTLFESSPAWLWCCEIYVDWPVV
jgi:hypothetical protein